MTTIPLIMTKDKDAASIVSEMGKKIETITYFKDAIGICGFIVTFDDGGQCVVLYSDSFRRIYG